LSELSLELRFNSNAEDVGIQVTFVRPSRWSQEDTDRVINGKLVRGPVLDHSEFNGSKS